MKIDWCFVVAAIQCCYVYSINKQSTLQKTRLVTTFRKKNIHLSWEIGQNQHCNVIMNKQSDVIYELSIFNVIVVKYFHDLCKGCDTHVGERVQCGCNEAWWRINRASMKWTIIGPSKAGQPIPRQCWRIFNGKPSRFWHRRPLLLTWINFYPSMDE